MYQKEVAKVMEDAEAIRGDKDIESENANYSIDTTFHAAGLRYVEDEQGNNRIFEDKLVRQQKGSGMGDDSPREAAVRDALVGVMRGAGIEVITDSKEAQRVLDEANGDAMMQAMIGGLKKASDFIVSFLKGETKQRSSKLEIPERANRLAERAIGHKIKSHTINANELTHSKKRHGINGSAITEKNIPLRDEDFALMPYIMSAPTRVVKGSMSSNGTESVRYEKELSNGIVVVVEREGRFDVEDMENITMWAEKKSATNVTVAQRASHSTSETIVISEADAVKIRKDAETAIGNDEQFRQQKGSGMGDVSPREAAVRDALVGVMRGAGVEVVTDVEEGQRVLDEANGGARMQAMINALDKAARTIQNWISNGVRGKVFTIELPESVRNMIRRAMGRDYDSHNITSNEIVHSMKNHGVGGRKLTPNSIPLRQEDFSLIPYIMTAPDRVEKASMDASGRESVRFYKNLSNGYVVVVEKEYKNSPDDMETISMWAEMSDKATNARQDAAPDTHVQNAILDIDAIKIRKDAETAIGNDEQFRQQKGSGVRFFRTADGHAYGFTAGGKVYIDPRIATAETPVHEYSHLWASALSELNPEGWSNIVGLMKGTAVWDEVVNTYSELKTDDEIADEVLSLYSGA